MNTLLIAPDSNLINTPDEARHIQEALGAQVINGRVTLIIVADAIANRIARRQTIDTLFFIGHGNLTGLQLTDGYISIADLCRYVKSANIRYLVLNTCESEYIALAIHHETDATVICTITKVDDAQAYATSRLLAESIASGYPVEEAYERTKPSGAGIQTYRIFPDRNQQKTHTNDAEYKTIQLWREVLVVHLNQMAAQVKQMIEEERNQRGREMQRLENKIDEQKSELVNAITILADQSKNTVTLPRHYVTVYTTAFLFLAIPIPLYFLEVRNLIGISAFASIIVAWIFYGMSHQTFAYLWGFIANRSKKP